MKAVIDCRMLGSGGIGTYLQSILPFLIKSFECTLILYTKDVQNFNSMKNIKIIKCDIKTFSLKELVAFPKEILKQINQNDFYYSPYCNVPCGIMIPVFTTIHDIVFLDVENLASKTGTFVRKFFYQRAINKSKTVFTVSVFSAGRIRNKLRLQKTPLVITYNAVPAWFTENISKNNSKKNDNLLFVGNIKKHKGLHTLLEAFKILQNKGFSNKLLIVGNSENFRTKDSSIKNEITEISNIEFTGKISDDKLKELYACSKLLIQPSLYEGFGMPPMEALSCGTNVVISDIPVFKEIYKDFPVTYFECENPQNLADKIIEALQKPSPGNLPDIYSFKRTSDIIIKSIQNEVSK